LLTILATLSYGCSGQRLGLCRAQLTHIGTAVSQLMCENAAALPDPNFGKRDMDLPTRGWR
jgi:hypothetical protein